MQNLATELRARFGPRIPDLFVAAFILSVPYILVNYGTLQENNDKLISQMKPEYILNRDEEFDYIIVGGGSAGAVVANRLSKDFFNQVLLLEAGGDPNPFQEVPAFSAILFGQKPIFHIYKTDVRANACLNTKGKCSILVGRGLGGSSGVNNLMYTRGSPSDYDEWSTITNDHNWAYENVVKVFKKLEDNHGFFSSSRSAHWKGGEVYISKEANSPVLREAFFRAAKQSDLQLRNFNSEFAKGYGPYDAMIKHGIRWDSYKAFLRPILRHKNLKVYRYSKAIKIHFDGSSKAVGVTYLRHGVKHYVRAKKEVVISAGAIESAKLLLLSGIGPRQHLQEVGVEPLINLPVGSFFQDHLTIDTLSFSVNKGHMFNPRRDMIIADIKNYLAHGTGPLAARAFNPGSSCVLRSSFENGNDAYPDLEFLIQAKTPFPSSSTSKDHFFIVPFLLRPKSFGYVKLASKNQEDEPKVNPNYLTALSDQNRLMDNLQYIVNFIENTTPFKKINGTMDQDQGVPECDSKGFKSQEYWKCFIRNKNLSGYHVFGSCRMGQAGDPKAVVDSKLRVYHTTGLRIIDNSVIPGVTSAHTCAPAIMIGEMGSTFILQNKL